MPTIVCFFFLIESATTEIYTLSLHDALPIFSELEPEAHNTIDLAGALVTPALVEPHIHLDAVLTEGEPRDRKSTRLNSSHPSISYAVFCLKKKKRKKTTNNMTIYSIVVHFLR